MRVLFDVQALQTASSRSRGIGFYTRNHLRGLAARREVELVALANGWLPSSDTLDELVGSLGPGHGARLQEGDRLRDVEERGEHHRRAIEAGVAAQGLAVGATIYHSTSPFEWEVWVPLAVPHLRVVATVYDLIPQLFPGEYLSGASPRFRHEYQRILDGLAGAERLLAISECTKRDLVRTLGIPPDKVHVVWAAADDRFQPIPDPDPDGSLRRRWGTGDRFVLYTGGYDFRKNFERLFEAFAAAAARRTHKLVVVCRLSDDERRRVRAMAEQAGLAEELVLTGFVPDDDQVRLYNLAEILVFPSRYEGFGLPVLEGMRCGVPVICSSVSSMPEIAGDAAELVDPLDPRAIRDAIDGVLGNPARAAELRSRGLARSALFTWDAVAKATAEVYRDLAEPPPRPWIAASGAKRGSPRVALFGPLPPAPSGIADFAGVLVPSLAGRCDVTAFVDAPDQDPPPGSTAAAAVHDGRLFDAVDGDRPFDHVVHQIGNSLHHEQSYRLVLERGGVVLLHDLVLHHLVMATTLDRGDARAYREELVHAHPEQGDRLADLVLGGWGTDSIYYGFPCIARLLESADALAVFSAHAARRAAALGFEGPIQVLPLAVRGGPDPVEPRAARRMLGVDENAFWIGSFGVQTPMKRPATVLAAFETLCAEHPSARLVFVGEAPAWVELEARVRASRFASRITVTGRVDEAQYRAWTEACDAVVALRYPHRSETSAAVLHAMERGRPVVVSDLGAMSELPQGTCIPVDLGERELPAVVAALRLLAKRPDVGGEIGRRAREHLRTVHAPDRTAEQLLALLAEIGPSRGRKRRGLAS